MWKECNMKVAILFMLNGILSCKSICNANKLKYNFQNMKQSFDNFDNLTNLTIGQIFFN